MRKLVAIILFFPFLFQAQVVFPEQLSKTFLSRLGDNDSLTYYQCHVDVFTPQLSTAGGQTITTAPEKYSLTEKFVIIRSNGTYMVRHYVSSYIHLPNRRFSGQKIREKSYWNYKYLKTIVLDDRKVLMLAALELKGQEPTEYDFAITKHNTNQIIIKKKKDFRQLVVQGNYLVSEIIEGKSVQTQ